MSDGIKIKIETEEVTEMINNMINKLDRPQPLLKNIQRMIEALTNKMFNGPMASTKVVRGVKWPKLSQKTVNRKKQLAKQGKLYGGATPKRPMISSGKTRDTHKVLKNTKTGFVYGTKTKSERGFSYPGYHNTGRFPWLFLNERVDLAQISIMVKNYIDGNMKKYSSYVKG